MANLGEFRDLCSVRYETQLSFGIIREMIATLRARSLYEMNKIYREIEIEGQKFEIYWPWSP